MDGLSASAAGWAAVASGVFWLLYLVLLVVELSGKVAYTATYKGMGIVTGVLQAAPIVIVAAFLIEAFGSGSAEEIEDRICPEFGHIREMCPRQWDLWTYLPVVNL